MSKDVYGYISQAEGEILCNAVKRVAKADLGDLASEADRYIKSNLAPNAIKTQWEMIRALSRTCVHLEKQNLLMEQDYKRKGLGRGI